MKTTIAMAMALCAFAAVAAGKAKPAAAAAKPPVSTNATWRAQVAKAAVDPAVLKSTMATLKSDKSAQLQFIAAVNAAIASMPVSPEAQAQHFAQAAQAALGSVSKDNVAAAVAEVYATVPVEHLPAVGNALAASGFKQDGDSTRTYSDADYKKKAEAVMSAVSQRLKGSGQESVRETLAIAMFAKGAAKDGSSLANSLADRFVPQADRALAKDTWLPAAAKGDYTNINGAADVEPGTEPDLKHIVFGTTSLAETGASLLASISTGGEETGNVFASPLEAGFNPLAEGMVDDNLSRVPAQQPAREEDTPMPPPLYGNTVP